MNNRYRICYLSSFLVFVTIFLASCAQTTLDRGLAEQIAKIKAIDNHTHISPAIAGQGTEEEPTDLLGHQPCSQGQSTGLGRARAGGRVSLGRLTGLGA